MHERVAVLGGGVQTEIAMDDCWTRFQKGLGERNECGVARQGVTSGRETRGARRLPEARTHGGSGVWLRHGG